MRSPQGELMSPLMQLAALKVHKAAHRVARVLSRESTRFAWWAFDDVRRHDPAELASWDRKF